MFFFYIYIINLTIISAARQHTSNSRFLFCFFSPNTFQYKLFCQDRKQSRATQPSDVTHCRRRPKSKASGGKMKRDNRSYFQQPLKCSPGNLNLTLADAVTQPLLSSDLYLMLLSLSLLFLSGVFSPPPVVPSPPNHLVASGPRLAFNSATTSSALRRTWKARSRKRRRKRRRSRSERL